MPGRGGNSGRPGGSRADDHRGQRWDNAGGRGGQEKYHAIVSSCGSADPEAGSASFPVGSPVLSIHPPPPGAADQTQLRLVAAVPCEEGLTDPILTREPTPPPRPETPLPPMPSWEVPRVRDYYRYYRYYRPYAARELVAGPPRRDAEEGHRDEADGLLGGRKYEDDVEEVEGGVAKKSGLFKTLSNIFISFVGSGILGLPFAFAQSGWLTGVAMMAAVAVVGYHCMMMLVWCKKHANRPSVQTFAELARFSHGPWAQRLVETLLVMSQAGFCVAYMIFIGQNMGRVLSVSTHLPIALATPFEMALALLRSLTALAPFSIVADVANASGILTVLSQAWGDVGTGPNIAPVTGLAALPFMFGVAVYCFEGMCMVLPLEASTRDRKNFPKVLGVGMTFVTALYIGFALAGYLAFGDATEEIVTLNLKQGLVTESVKVCLCVGLFFTFPVMMVPVYEIFERNLSASTAFRSRLDMRYWPMVFRGIRGLTVIGVALVALVIPSFGAFISLVGSLCCCTLALVMPPLIHLRLFGAELSLGARCLDYLYVVLGVVGAVVGTTNSVIDILEGKQSVH
ncbi:unnamed protein product [Pedinophyceae sp. YPF-701]|nr:unnamed protein product [Pedinophyceae sp. YPF-701]